MEGIKKWFASSGIWGGIFAVIGSVLTMAGVGAADVADATTQANNIVTNVINIGTAVGALVAIYGRWKASKKIG